MHNVNAVVNGWSDKQFEKVILKNKRRRIKKEPKRVRLMFGYNTSKS